MRLVTETNEAPRRPSARIKTVAKDLDTDASAIRRLIAAGELETHTIGKRGVRVYLDSVAAYQDRQTRPVKRGTPANRPKPSRATKAAHAASIDYLKRKGLLP
jgi:hypothetical protein